MSTVFIEFSKPYIALTGGVMDTGETASFDPVTAASLIASGVAVSSSAPSAPTPPATTRVKFTETTMVANSPPLYNAGEIATFPAAISAALVAQGLVVLN
jgi:hypothetical protein